MTVTYTAKVATVRFRNLWKLLKRWRGSVYKILWKDALLFFGIYTSLSILYRVILSEPQRRVFEKTVLYCYNVAPGIPVAFVLGFYVTIIVNRWWDQMNNFLPWPDTIALGVTAFVHGNDDRGRLMRRTIMRYVNLSWILCLCSISTVAKKRFPTLDHLVEIGMMTKNEQEIWEKIKCPSNKYFIPLVWAATLISRAKKEDRIYSEFAKVNLVELIMRFRSNLGTLFNYDWLSVPLVYTQLVTIAVHSYFIASVIGQQYLDPRIGYVGKELDAYIPVFFALEFLFYMGWLKCAESLLNPFGEDDDDFDTNWVLDRNIRVSYLIVDELHSEIPELIKDAYWDSMDIVIPYTAAAEASKVAPYLGSTNEMELKKEEIVFLPLVTVPEDGEPTEDDGRADSLFARLKRTLGVGRSRAHHGRSVQSQYKEELMSIDSEVTALTSPYNASRYLAMTASQPNYSGFTDDYHQTFSAIKVADENKSHMSYATANDQVWRDPSFVSIYEESMAHAEHNDLDMQTDLYGENVSQTEHEQSGSTSSSEHRHISISIETPDEPAGSDMYNIGVSMNSTPSVLKNESGVLHKMSDINYSQSKTGSINANVKLKNNLSSKLLPENSALKLQEKKQEQDVPIQSQTNQKSQDLPTTRNMDNSPCVPQNVSNQVDLTVAHSKQSVKPQEK